MPVDLRQEGVHPVGGVVSDLAGNTAPVDHSISIDKTPPVVEILQPIGGTVFSTQDITVSGSATDAVSAVAQVTVGGLPAVLEGLSFTASEVLSQALTAIQVEAIDLAGNVGSSNTEVFFGRPESPVLDSHPALTNETTLA